ncbi:sensor domain-containing diguanylate cyclase [Vogesella indigofera]|uniref:sensor domain-containing diguanylate cyclase n=1 Tax=Vogesella indigofera TaxID=45465 RepID=UPI00234EF9FC|nr:diguanylate cyclase [Vogesella indigofera]MDC7709480.1 diguanylate cyclase [Vogesella indigofera]
MTTTPRYHHALLLVLLYVSLAWLGMWLAAKPPSSLTVVWLPSGIGLIMLLLAGRRGLPLVLLSSAIANAGGWLYFGGNWGTALLAGLLLAPFDSLQSWLAWRGCGAPRRLLHDVGGLQRFFWRVCVLPPLLTTWAMYLINHALGATATAQGHLAGLAMMTSGDCLGLFVVTPLYLVLREVPWPRLAGLTLKIAALVALPLLLAQGVHPWLIWLLGLTLIYVAIRYRIIGSSIAVALLTLASLLLLLSELGPQLAYEHSVDYAALSLMILSLGLAPHCIGLVIQQLDDVNHTLEQRVAERTRALREVQKQLETMAYSDSLTGLGNRHAFYIRLQEEQERAIRRGRRFALALLDIDHFKRINDSYGHQTGDEVLRAVAVLMQNSVRAIDRVYRWGGEEFMILFPDAGADDAMVPLQRICQEIGMQPLSTTHGELYTSVSIGVTEFAGRHDSIDALIGRVDALLYQAKRDGRNRIAR